MARLTWVEAKDGRSALGYHRLATLPVAEVRTNVGGLGPLCWRAFYRDRELHGTFVVARQAQAACEQAFSAEERQRRRER